MKRKSALTDIVTKAKGMAMERGSKEAQPIHILLALLSFGNGISNQILEDLRADTALMRETAIELAFKYNTEELITVTPDLSAKSEQIMREADDIAKVRNDDFVGTEHLLLAFAASRSKYIMPVFTRHSISFDDIERAINDMLQPAGGGQETKKKQEPKPRPKQAGDKKLFDWLRDFTAEADRLDGAFFREETVSEIITTLMRRRKNCPTLIGEPGVGKTAIVEELAKAMVASDLPSLKGSRLLSVDIAGMLAGTKYRGEFEEKLKATLKLAEENNDILFIDEAHMIVGAGDKGGGMDMSNLLKPGMARGLRIVMATTLEEYRKRIETDEALARRTMPINVPEPTPEQAEMILLSSRKAYEDHHGVVIPRQCVADAVALSARYIGRMLPDKAFDVIDEACSAAKIKGRKEITPEDVLRVVEMISRVKIDHESSDVLGFKKRAGERVRGQAEAIDVVHRALMRSAARISDPRRPIASLLFLGPTGVGKTELAKTVADMHANGNLIRIDCSELMESNSTSKLIGAPPGYVGYENGGILTKRVKEKPFSVVLFDEIEKAHREVWNLLLQLMDDGRLTDSTGNVVDFTNTVVILTSNVGHGKFTPRSLGFGATGTEPIDPTAAVKSAFPSEMINRFDGVVSFNGLEHDVLCHIAADQLTGIARRCSAKIEFDQSVIEAVAETVRKEDPHGGGRMVQRLLNKLVVDPLSDYLIANGNENPIFVMWKENGGFHAELVKDGPAEVVPMLEGSAC